MSNTKIPPNLLVALQKIESSGTIPLLIPQQLENFLTEIGIYRSSMTPDDAWQALRSLANPAEAKAIEAGEELPLTGSVSAENLEIKEAKKEQAPQTEKVEDKAPKPLTPRNPILRELQRRRGKNK